MPSTSTQYGVYSPQALDPSQVENTLAGQVGASDPAAANILLNTYQAQRQSAQGSYDYELSQQHDFARQQLEQQLYEANLKGLAEAKDPTVLQLMAGNPMYQQVLGGNRANIADVVARARAMQDASTYEKLGQGTSAFRAGGAAPDISGLNQQYGLNLSAVDPTSVEAARINAAARIQAAKIHAASANPPGPSTGIKIVGPFGEQQMNYPGKMTQAQIEADLDRRGVPHINSGSSSSANLPDAVAERGPTPGAPAQDVAAPSPAKKPMTPRPDNEMPGKRGYQDIVINNIERYKGHPAYKDIKAGMDANGGRPLVAPDGKGGWRPQGASGKVY